MTFSNNILPFQMISYEGFNGFHLPISVCCPCVINWHNPDIPANFTLCLSFTCVFPDWIVIGLLKLFGGGLEWTLTTFKGIIQPKKKKKSAIYPLS